MLSQVFQALRIAVNDEMGALYTLLESLPTLLTPDGRDLIGLNVLDCHPEPARSLLQKMMAEELKHVYTIDKKGKKKLIYQIPWYQDGEYAGFIELSMILPDEPMQHYVRK